MVLFEFGLLIPSRNENITDEFHSLGNYI